MTFRDTEKCIYYLNRIKEDESKVVLIVSSKKQFLFPDILLHLSQELPQIDSVYILYLNDTIEHIYVKDKIYTDIRTLFNDVSELPGVERYRRKGFIRDDFTISAISSTVISATSTNTNLKLNSYHYRKLIMTSNVKKLSLCMLYFYEIS